MRPEVARGRQVDALGAERLDEGRRQPTPSQPLAALLVGEAPQRLAHALLGLAGAVTSGVEEDLHPHGALGALRGGRRRELEDHVELPPAHGLRVPLPLHVEERVMRERERERRPRRPAETEARGLPGAHALLGAQPLADADAHQRVERERQQHHHDQGAPVAQRLAQLLAVDEEDLRGLTRGASASISGRNACLQRLHALRGLQRRRRPLAQQPAAVEQPDAIAEQLGLGHVVGREEDRAPAARARADEVDDEAAREHVEAGGGLVEDQHRRVVQRGAGERDPLPLAGGELAAAALEERARSGAAPASSSMRRASSRPLHAVERAEVARSSRTREPGVEARWCR